MTFNNGHSTPYDQTSMGFGLAADSVIQGKVSDYEFISEEVIKFELPAKGADGVALDNTNTEDVFKFTKIGSHAP